MATDALLFDFAAKKPNKTIDIGRGGISVSLDAQGRVLQASTYHHKHGLVLAVPFEQFHPEKFYNQEYVRSYRTRMLEYMLHDKPGFGLDFSIQNSPMTLHTPDTNTAIYRTQPTDSIDLSIVVKVTEYGTIEQYVEAANTSDTLAVLPYTYDLGLSLNRASYGQLTEGGPLPLPRSHNILRGMGQTTARASSPELGTQLLIGLAINGQPVNFGSLIDQEVYGVPLQARIHSLACIDPQATVRIHATFRLLSHLRENDVASLWTANQPVSDYKYDISSWKCGHLLTTYILRRNVDYILANCVIPVSEGVAAIITDHVALPLGWNRDNYWQIRLLLQTYRHRSGLIHRNHMPSYEAQIKSSAYGHLNWVFTQAKRPHGFWHRSYLVTGQPKDSSIFQLDQQCYPLLELCDYLEYFPEDRTAVQKIVNSGTVREILTLLKAKQDACTGLWLTQESPGDDPIIYPFHFSSHVLLWRTFSRLRDLFAQLSSSMKKESTELDCMAVALRKRIMQAFTFEHEKYGRKIFAYLVDGHGQHTFYHDANDIPTLFAHEWGFVSTQDEIQTWQSTMKFGLSPTNVDGYCKGTPYGGLGSIHSPGAWTLGYFQELAYASWADDQQRTRAVWRKIAASMQWDGTFSEAVDPITAKCTSKAWFSWPGAMIGVLLIRMKANNQEDVLLSHDDVNWPNND